MNKLPYIKCRLNDFYKIATEILPPDISILLRGRHGVGKSQLLKKVCEFHGIPPIDRRISQLTEGDLIGLPYKVNDRSTKFLPMDWFIQAMDEPSGIILDEFDRGSEEVQQAGMELILDRSIQGNLIHKESRVYAAINGGHHGSQYLVNKIDPAIYDRFFVIDFEPTIEEWLSWASENTHELIHDFISKNKNYLEDSKPPKDSTTIRPSRRSWARLSDVISVNEGLLMDVQNKRNRRLFESLCNGFVGMEAAIDFRSFVEQYKIRIGVHELLNNFDAHISKVSKFTLEDRAYYTNKIKDIAEKDKLDSTQLKSIKKLFDSLDNNEQKLNLWSKLTSSSVLSYNSLKITSMLSSEIRKISS